MTPFFRRIRLKLANENKFLKYSRYAIGEIVLVVIGILIAVQINSWVNKTKLQKDNEVFLKKMVFELELNKKRMRTVVYGDSTNTKNVRYLSLERAIKNGDSILNMTYRGLNSDDLSFIFNNRIGAGGSYLNIHNSIYEELINTGKLYTLGSDTLIMAIKKYYKRCDREDLYNKRNSGNMDAGFTLIENSYSKLILDFKRDSINFNIKSYPWYFDKTSENYQNLQIALDKIIGGQSANRYKINEIYKYSDSLIEIIQSELKNKYD